MWYLIATTALIGMIGIGRSIRQVEPAPPPAPAAPDFYGMPVGSAVDNAVNASDTQQAIAQAQSSESSLGAANKRTPISTGPIAPSPIARTPIAPSSVSVPQPAPPRGGKRVTK